MPWHFPNYSIIHKKSISRKKKLTLLKGQRKCLCHSDIEQGFTEGQCHHKMLSSGNIAEDLRFFNFLVNPSWQAMSHHHHYVTLTYQKLQIQLLRCSNIRHNTCHNTIYWQQKSITCHVLWCYGSLRSKLIKGIYFC